MTLFGPWGRLFLWRVAFGRWCARHLPCALGFHEWQIPIGAVACCEKCLRLHPRAVAKFGIKAVRG